MAAAPDPVASGAYVIYTLDVANAGPDPAEDVSVGLLLPVVTCADPRRPTPARWCARSARWPTAAAQVTVTAGVDAPAGSVLDALAVVTTSTPDPDGADNARNLTTDVGP